VEYTTLNFNPPRVLAVPLSLSALPHFSTVLRKIFKLSRAAAASAEGAARRSHNSANFSSPTFATAAGIVIPNTLQKFIDADL
jgi:hypothetical protein